ncbi:Regulator of V-ATPase in vacuolar membrane protein 2 [Wickerhamomyces ciferrii]|uniref:Regulator of V-ATPase in vacuolar membrane protein 2 n=1 Tax=Wickerhamomyces ciferrii (strain ATCC 14091 / BCRC 22168 / CBS 111 / JCM 3599 / NBRC 0793 / NRRL Y-1031 F-60-10) TaxID=1206466 RepID=K0KHH2_WICCF|nr:Regulator of V-ATPase in vacuolar membrane protein 2 [Wickerhamomyces ciferrii]CCH41627.1 Regulator of V-ATPase in vacuolar membrane protein 2 [Wickerhamomyces ciferrii]
MTTEIFPKIPNNEIKQQEETVQKSEQKWLIEHIIKPELPKIIETLGHCLDVITSKDIIKLPISSNRTEQVKGIVSRSSSELIDLDIKLHLKTLNRKIHLKLQSPIELVQITKIIGMITELIGEIEILKQFDLNDINGFLDQLRKILKNLSDCNNTLNKPHESILFPQHGINLSETFDTLATGQNLSQFQDKLTIDFFILNTEISIEFKSLEKITESPWNEIDSNGISHVDKLREGLKNHTIKLNDILDRDKRKLGHVFGLNKFSTNDYLTRSITFNNSVVIEVEKLLIHCQDPNLISIGAKLNGLEHLTSKMFKNLELSLM